MKHEIIMLSYCGEYIEECFSECLGVEGSSIHILGRGVGVVFEPSIVPPVTMSNCPYVVVNIYEFLSSSSILCLKNVGVLNFLNILAFQSLASTWPLYEYCKKYKFKAGVLHKVRVVKY